MGSVGKPSGLEKRIESYRSRFKKYGVSPRALRWMSEKAARVRYEELIADIDFEGRSVLDVGCGFGNIIEYIGRKARKFDYTGVDIVPEFIKAARKKYPKYKFILRDYFSNPYNGNFDVVICSGVLNSNIKNAMIFRKKAIKTMFDNAGEVIAFNMAGGYPQPKNKKENRVWYADSLEILKYCLSLSAEIIFRHQYRKHDFTVILFKDDLRTYSRSQENPRVRLGG